MSLKHVCKGYSAAIDLTNESIIYHDLAAQRTILPPAEFVHSGQIWADNLTRGNQIWTDDGADLDIPIASFPDIVVPAQPHDCVEWE